MKSTERKRRTVSAPEPAGIEELAGRLKFSFPTGHIWLGEERMILLHRDRKSVV